MEKSKKTPKGHDIPKCFKDMASWEDVDNVIDDIWDKIYDASGVDQKKFQEAMNRVYFDGYFGPVPQADWDEEHPDNSLSTPEALEILERGMNSGIQDIEYLNPEYEYEVENPLPLNNCKIEARTIRRELFSFYYKIYGG